jgi:hypothetical protein
MSVNWVGLGAAVVMVLFVAEMLRRGILREKFAALWLVVSGLLILVAVFPQLLRSAADALGFALPSNLLFFVSILFLLLVAVQLSYEVSKLEARTRRLAEDVALLRSELQERPAAPTGDGQAGVEG